MLPEYPLLSGTPIGEVRNEVYLKCTKEQFETAHYGWHHEHISPILIKMYTMVNTDPVQFLVATITKDSSLINSIDPHKPYAEPGLVSIDLNWINANAPFLTKAELDAQGIPYAQ